MLDLKTFIIAQRTMWVKRLQNPKKASWKAYPEYAFSAILGLDSFKTDLDTKINKNKITPFYWTIIKSWNILKHKITEHSNIFDIRRQWLWMNKYIKINKQEFKWTTWRDHGINIIH
jgi:hypothetical protein